MIAKQSKVTGPAIHPNCEVLQAGDKTPEPITAVMIWATQLHKVPDCVDHKRHWIQDWIESKFNRTSGWS